jgi:hypothetical protein
MTIMFDDGLAEPGTHVFLIGVGAYPFLNEGSDPEKRFADTMGMGQLSSPPLSVRALTEWFMDRAGGFYNPTRPLRSLELFCSAATPLTMEDALGVSTNIEPARMATVRPALVEWIERAGRNANNMALFFFCGHGLAFAEAENALLLEEFGSDRMNPLSGAIAFDQMRLGIMRHCTANMQVHLVDACRTPPNSAFLTKYGNFSGEPIATAGISKALRDKVAPVYFATGLAAAAYGLPGQPSIFTQGLLTAMRGAASRDNDLHWEVQIASLAEGINKCIASMTFQAQPQFCQPRDTGRAEMIHRLRTSPEVIVKIFTRDPALLPQTILAHEHEHTKVRAEHGPGPTPWWTGLTSGAYRFEALAATDRTNVLGQSNKHVLPPSAEVGL